MLRSILLVSTLLFHVGVHAEIDWTGVSGLSDSDKADIVRLSGNLGIYAPERASELRLFPTNRRHFVISSKVTVSGLRRAWREMHVCRISDGSCGSRSNVNVGDWAVAEGPSLQERWRFSDDDWFIDVELGSGISYAEARTIVIAISRNLLVTTPELKDWRTFDASSISSIRTDDPVAREFSVYIGSGAAGYVLQVRLRGSEVQLYELVITRA